MEFITIVGLAAAALTTIAFVPQIVRVYRTKHTRDLSLWMFVCSATGVFLWLVYGLERHDPAVIVANSVTLPLVLYIIAMKLKYK
jgi:MtN3 and saliva related transmembrane protein